MSLRAERFDDGRWYLPTAVLSENLPEGLVDLVLTRFDGAHAVSPSGVMLELDALVAAAVSVAADLPPGVIDYLRMMRHEIDAGCDERGVEP